MNTKSNDMTRGGVMRQMLMFALPLMLGNILQQCYNIADTFIVGRFVGAGALAAVGAAYALMVFVNSVQFGLCMGSGVVLSMLFGARRMDELRRAVFMSFVMIAVVAVSVNVILFVFMTPILRLLNVPGEIFAMMRSYMWIVTWGMFFTFLYNYACALLRAVGDSVTPLLVIVFSALANIGLDLVFVCVLGWGVDGAAWATVISQAASSALLILHLFFRERQLVPRLSDMRFDRRLSGRIISFSLLTCFQQSIMNFGILLVQGLVNSFGVVVMAAFSAAVKIDTLAYVPAQDFGNAFSTFIAQNYGARRFDRIMTGIRRSAAVVVAFCLLVSAVVFVGAEWMMSLFVPAGNGDVVAVGAQYLRIEGACYVGIGILFLFYGYYRAIARPGLSVVLTVVSLGTRVVLAYALSSLPAVGVLGIWWSVPIGWVLADVIGIVCYRRTLSGLRAECAA